MREPSTAPFAAIHRLVWTGLLAALVAVGSFIAVPVGPFSPVPVTLQTFFVLLAGLVLGSRNGVCCVILYIAAGCLGLPVFSGGKAGLAVLLGPTGGFVYGFVLSAALCGRVGAGRTQSIGVILGTCIVASALTLACGVLQLGIVLDISYGKAFAAGALPFLPGLVLKSFAATAAYRFLATRRLLPI